jgi:hypothetical protein
LGVRTPGLDIKAGAAELKADRAAGAEAEAAVERWNLRLATGRDCLVSNDPRRLLSGPGRKALDEDASIWKVS